MNPQVKIIKLLIRRYCNMLRQYMARELCGCIGNKNDILVIVVLGHELTDWSVVTRNFVAQSTT